MPSPFVAALADVSPTPFSTPSLRGFFARVAQTFWFRVDVHITANFLPHVIQVLTKFEKLRPLQVATVLACLSLPKVPSHTYTSCTYGRTASRGTRGSSALRTWKACTKVAYPAEKPRGISFIISYVRGDNGKVNSSVPTRPSSTVLYKVGVSS